MDNFNGYVILIFGSMVLLFAIFAIVLCLCKKEDTSDFWGGILLVAVIGAGSVALGWHYVLEENPRPENPYFQKAR